MKNKIKLLIIVFIIFSCDNSKKIEEQKEIAIQNKVDSLSNLANYKFASLNDYQSAINLYEEALKIDPENLEALANQALILNDAEYYSKAIPKFTKVIGLIENGKGRGHSKEVEASMFYSERGRAKLQLNDLHGALSDFTYSIENGINGGYEDYMYRGTVYLRLGRKNEACSDFSKAGEQGNKEAYDYINKYCQ